jgi:hypothetical protein
MGSFNLKQLFGSIALIAIGISLKTYALPRMVHNYSGSHLAWMAAGALVGAGLFLLIKRPILGACIGIIIQLFWISMYFSALE